MNKPSKPSSCDNGEELKEQVEDHLIANEEAIKIHAENDDHIEDYSMMEAILRRSDVHPDSGGKIILYPITAKNGPM